MVLTHHPHLQCRGLKMGRAIPLPTLRALVVYTGRTFTFTITVSSYVYRRLYINLVSLFYNYSHLSGFELCRKETLS